ncbi:MAG: hypothetical protein AAFP84_21125 [Actinomycetota bacterium]
MSRPWKRRSSTVVLSSVVDGLDTGAQLLRDEPISRWRTIDHDMRRRTYTSPDWFDGFGSVQPDAVPEYASLVVDAPNAIALLAMHPNGYVRQAALQVLTDRQLDSLLPTAVLRATDWVGPIRSDAIAVLDDVRQARRHLDLLPCLGLLTEERGSYLARRDYIAELRSELLNEVETSALVGVLRSSDVRCRQAAARALVEVGKADAGFAAASTQDDPATLAIVINGLSQTFWASRGNVDQALESKFSSARSAGFFYLQRLDPDAATALAEESTTSRRATMRSLAQRHLSAQGVDVAERYRNLLATDRRMALIGLSETGNKDDVSFAIESIQSADELTRAAAVRAAARTDGRSVEPTIAAALGDESRVVAFTAGRELARLGPGRSSLDQAWRIAEAASDDHQRRAAFNVFAHAGRWDQLTGALRGISSSDDPLTTEGHRLLGNCLRSWNRSFAEPQADLAAEIRTLVPRCLGSIDIGPSELLTTSLRPYLPDAAATLTAWLDSVGRAVRDTRSLEWERQLRGIPVVEPHIGQPVVDEALLFAMTRSSNLAPVAEASAAALRANTRAGRRLFARAWRTAEMHERWQVGDCHADELRRSTGVGTTSRDDWQALTADNDHEVAEGTASIIRWLDGRG